MSGKKRERRERREWAFAWLFIIAFIALMSNIESRLVGALICFGLLAGMCLYSCYMEKRHGQFWNVPNDEE